MEYSTTFAAGTLLHDEAVRILEKMDEGMSPGEIGPDVLEINSQAGRERRFQELERRLGNVDREVWDDFLRCTLREQHVILYYACMKAYELVADIHMNVVLPAWRSITQEVHRSDIQRFLDEQVDTHPEIDIWSERTHNKVQQVVRKMLREVGILKESRLQKLHLPRSFWARFARTGDVWFLESMFLSKDEREAVIELVRGG